MKLPRPLGTMITHGYPRIPIASELELARKIGASVLEILPNWASYPDPIAARLAIEDAGLVVHSAHGCWGGQTIKAERVDLGSADSTTVRASIDDLRRCVDWLREAGGTFLVVHPGGLSDRNEFEERRASLGTNLLALAEHASQANTTICVENMPPGVWPGTRMADLKSLLDEIDHPSLGLALDTGHAHLSAEPASESMAAGPLLLTTHVHDNDGRRDLHFAPGSGTVDWRSWKESLDRIDYKGPILLECIRSLREDPKRINDSLIELLAALTSADSPD